MIESGVCWSLFNAFFTITKQTRDKLTLTNTVDFLFSKFLLGCLRTLPFLLNNNLLRTLGAANGHTGSFRALEPIHIVGMDLCGVIAEHIYIA